MIKTHRAAIHEADELLDFNVDGPATKIQRLLVGRHFPRDAVMSPTRRKATVFANLAGTNKRRFETIDDFNEA